MRIGTKLKVLTLVTVVGLGAILAITILGLNAIQEASDTAHRRESYTSDILEIKASALSTIMLDPTLRETKDVFVAAQQNIAQHGDAALRVIRRAEIKDELQAVLGKWTHYDQESQNIIKLSATDAKSAGDKVMPLYKQEFKALQASLEKFIADRQQEAEQARNHAKSVSNGTFWQVISLIVVVAVLNIVTVLQLALSLRGTLRGIGQQLVPLRQGDLTQRLPATTKDELGEIATGINAFIQELQAIVQRTRDRSTQLTDAASRLSAASADVLRRSNSEGDATSSVAAAVEEFSVSIDQVSDNASQAEQKATVSGELSQRGGEEVIAAIAEIRHIEQVVSGAAQQMDALGHQAREIGSIVNVIKEVADQTNLLALNAAIEAARAGESGRGFAVVADEVRKLAERTTASALEITKMVTAIQQTTENAARVMQEGNVLVIQGVKQAELAGASMQQIKDSSHAVVGAISDISSALREQRVAGAEIANNVERIAQMSEEERITASDVSEAADKLGKLASELQAEVAKFRA